MSEPRTDHEQAYVALSADGHRLKPEMTIWVNSNIVGYPPKRATVGRAVSENKIEYPEPDEQGYLGCRAGAAWVSLRKALAHAIMVGDGE